MDYHFYDTIIATTLIHSLLTCIPGLQRVYNLKHDNLKE